MADLDKYIYILRESEVRRTNRKQCINAQAIETGAEGANILAPVYRGEYVPLAKRLATRGGDKNKSAGANLAMLEW